MGLLSGLSVLGKIAGAFKSFMGWLRDAKIFQAGRDRERAESNQRLNDDVRTANEAVNHLNDPTERKRLHDKYRRQDNE